MNLSYQYNAEGESRVLISEGGHTYSCTKYGVDKDTVRVALTNISLPYNEQDAIKRRIAIVKERLIERGLRESI